MKYRSILAASIAMAPPAIFATASTPAPAPDIPMMTATTANIGNHASYTSSGRQDTSSGVKVDLRYLKTPKSEYEVQCFFVAKADQTQKSYIYGTQVDTSQAGAYNKTFEAGPLSISPESVLVPTNNAPVSLKDSAAVAPIGPCKVYGWVVRIISQGKVVAVESNQIPLKDAGERSADAFDSAVKKAAK